ncbi:MAG: hypothetical protein JOZ46_08980 [Candidatus Dormibacteraeota bacterium]|nr:hypothetical protein [Candidatus Dormibacteraeota bacterium]MBV9525930.1 hypothetical protein [Candidatus Dormibacteraeota bacterium]
MPRPTPTSLAQRSRDEGLSRLRRLTWVAGIGAAALTAVASLIAAETIPGHSQAAAAAPASSSGSPDQSGSGAQLPSDQQAPANQPPGPGGGAPIAVSGGS